MRGGASPEGGGVESQHLEITEKIIINFLLYFFNGREIFYFIFEEKNGVYRKSHQINLILEANKNGVGLTISKEFIHTLTGYTHIYIYKLDIHIYT